MPALHLTRERRRAALDAVCDTFAPGSVELGVPDRVLELAQLNPSVSDAQLAALLAYFSARGLARKSQQQREAELLAWCDSRLPARRAAFNALRKGVLLAYYAHPDAEARIGYPGPLGPPADAKPPRIHPTAAGADLDCDVCVVGSGAGGGVAAAVLAQAGLDVVVLEAGRAVSESDFVGDELDAYRTLYWGAAAATTDDGGIGLLAGQCLGGTTTVNWTTAFATPDTLRDEWGGPFPGDDFGRSLAAVAERSGVNTDHNRPSPRDAIMKRGLEALGWHVAAMPRNVRGCDQDGVCGYCGFGCQLGAKQSTLVTWLEDAHVSGARIVPDARAERVATAGGRATAVEATTNGRRFVVRARAVVAACGALQTPALLLRSGVRNENVGRHLHLHPVTAVAAVFDEEVQPWTGTIQALYSDEHADLDGGYGLKYETGPIHPGVLVAFAPWRGAGEHAALLAELPRTSGIGLLLRDDGEGRVRITRTGRLRISYRLAADDARRVRIGIDGAARILEAAGARRIRSSHARQLDYEPGPGRRERFLADVERAGFAPGRCAFFSFHHMGSARVGADPATSACDWDGETWDVRGLYVMDGSSFPSASGVNPMLTIEAIAHLNASRLAAELR